MRLLRARFTIRRMMAAVAVSSLMLWAGKMLSLSATYRDLALQFDPEPLGATQIWSGPKTRPRVIHPPSASHLWAREMADRFWHAARHPWLPLQPDLPPPDGVRPLVIVRSVAQGTVGMPPDIRRD